MVSNKTLPYILGTIFALCLAFNWNGVRISLDKSELPSLIFNSPETFDDLKRVMLKLREEVYDQYEATGSNNVVISAYKQRDMAQMNRLVPVQIGKDQLMLQSALINELRGTFLLHPYDEVNAIRALYQMHPRKWDFNPRLFVYGAIFVYYLGFALVVAGKLGAYVLSSNIAYYLDHPEQMSQLYASGEFAVGAVTALGVWAIFAVGSAWKNRRVGVLAAFFYALVPVFMLHSHRLKPHGFSLPFVLMACWYCLKLNSTPYSRRSVFLTGLWAGFGIGVFYTHWFFLLPLVLVSIWHKSRNEQIPGNAYLIGLASIVLGFVLFNPYYVLAPKQPFQELGVLFNSHAKEIGTFEKFLHFMRHEIIYGIGWPWVLAAILGIIIGLKQREKGWNLVLIGTILSPLGSILSRGDAYYAAGFFCFLVLWMAYGVDFILSKNTALGSVFLILLGVFGFLHQSYYAAFFRQREPQYAMSQWIRTQIPDGSLIVRVRDKAWFFGLPFQFWRYRLPLETLVTDLKGPQATTELSRLRLKQDTEFPSFVFVAAEAGLPNKFMNDGETYQLIADFHRTSPLDGYFKPNLTLFFGVHYYVYGRLPIVTSEP